MSATTTDGHVLDVWAMCQEIYLQRGGIKLSFPKGTDPVKTYQYRYAQRVAEYLAEWGFDQPTSRRFIEIAVNYAKEKHILHKGLSLLCQGNLPEIVHAMLLKEAKHVTTQMGQLERTHNWVSRQIGTKNAIDTLLYKPQIDGYCNLVKWYHEQRLNDLYLSLSDSCWQALARLAKIDSVERQEITNQNRLYIIRIGFLQDRNNVREAKRILGGDWVRCP